VDWEQGRVYFGGHSRFFADMGEISREAIAEVDGGGSDFALLQK
jgi:hypothetical protein